MRAIELVRRLTERWDRGDIEGVLAGYTEDVDYFEVGGRRLRGREQLRGYLESYFATWDNRWRISRIHQFADAPGVVAFWDVQARRRGEEETATVSGMDLLMLRFDTAQLR